MSRQTRSNSSKHTGRKTNASERPGFTLLETLVAIAAVVVVAAGLAAVFDSIGKTVAAGRRVSRVNEYGRLLEQQLRRDFDRMARDGVMVIRQQFADVDGDNQFDADLDRVPLFEDQERGVANEPGAWRRRRVDELLFFARGEFESVRSAVSDGDAWASVKSNEAMIYYGHGMRTSPSAAISRSPRVNETNSINRNELTGTNRHTLGYVATNPATTAPSRRQNPNVFADEWILVRQQTVLAAPGVTDRARPPIPGIPATPAPFVNLQDKDAQVAGQPAAVSVFRSINRATTIPELFNPSLQLDDYLWYVSDAGREGNFDQPAGVTEPVFGPQLTSGIVDIATTSIEEVRRIVTGYAYVSNSNPPLTLAPGEYNDGTQSRLPGLTFTRALGELQLDPPWSCLPTKPTFANWESLDYMHAWMDNLMPGRAMAHVGGSVEGPIAGLNQDYDDVDRGVRIRTEAGAADLLDILSIPAPATPDPTIDARRRDRQTMGAFNLAIGCSEFVVDWTFGTTSADPNNPNTGTVHWYGPETACGFYEYDGQNGADDCNVRLGSTVAFRSFTAAGVATQVQRGSYPITDRLVYGFRAADPQYRDPGQNPPVFPLSVSSFFGTIDPTYAAAPVGAGGVGLSLEGGPGIGQRSILVTDPTYLDPLTGNTVLNTTPAERPWSWPRMVRIRVTIADPIEKGVESTFEYVFNVPAVEPN